MSTFADIKKFSSLDFSLAICVCLATVAPGFLTLYLFKPLLIQNLETLKVLIFSLALTLPLLAINTIVLGLSAENTVNQKLKEMSLIGGIIAVISFYPALLIAYFFEKPFICFLMLLILFEFIWLAAFCTNGRLKNI